MTQHPHFLTESYQHYAAECRRMSALARPPQRDVPSANRSLKLWLEQASHMAARYRRPQHALLTIKQPAFS